VRHELLVGLGAIVVALIKDLLQLLELGEKVLGLTLLSRRGNICWSRWRSLGMNTSLLLASSVRRRFDWW
jgi:hypothetical protein